MTRDDNTVLNAQQAHKLEAQYHNKLIKQARQRNPYNALRLSNLKKWYKISKASQKKKGMQPWIKKNIDNYQKAMGVENKINQQVIAKERYYDSGLNQVVKKRTKLQANHDVNGLNKSRLYRTQNDSYQKAPVKAIKLLHKQQQDYHDHLEDNRFRIMTGLAQIMCNEGQYSQTQLLAVRDTIRTRYLIKHNYPQAHTDQQMLKHVNLSNSVLYQHRKVYQGQNIRPAEVIDNPMYQKLLGFKNRFKGGIKRDLQRIDQATGFYNQGTSTINQQTGEEHRYIQRISNQVRNEAQFALKDDPVIRKAQKQFNKIHPAHHHLQQVTKGQWDVKVGQADKEMAMITNQLYPNQPYVNQDTNRSIYKAQLAKFHQNPHYKDYLTPQASRVINTYQTGLKEHKIKQPSFNHNYLAKQIQPHDNKNLANEFLDKIHMYKPSIKHNYHHYMDKFSNWTKGKAYQAKEKFQNHNRGNLSYQSNIKQVKQERDQGFQR